MNLITTHYTEVTSKEAVNSVNARDLHQYLEIKQEFANWMKYQIERGFFEEGKDYILLDKNVMQKQEKEENRGGHNAKEYLLTIETAKSIAMMSQTPKGKEVRDYFIEVEKQYHSLKEALDATVEKFRLGMPQEPNQRRVGTPLTDREKEICEVYFRVDQTNAHISRVLGCDARTVGRYRAEYEEGEQTPTLPLYQEEV